MARVFLSYSRSDSAVAGMVAESLGASGHQVWWDFQIHGGSRFGDEIMRALAASDVVAVLWSPASIESGWVLDEAGEGRDSGKLVPAMIGECRPPLGFRQFQSVDLTRWTGGALPAAILEAIDRLVGSEGMASGAQDASGPAPGAAGAGGAATAAATPEAIDDHSICVLPFANLSGDREQEYFSDGITDDIITDLSRLSSLVVTARHTAFTFKGQNISVSDVARATRVRHVLDGSVRRAGSRLRITVQLVDAAKEETVWAERFDREMTDIFAIQDEISQAIVKALKLRILPREKQAIARRGTASVDAYNLFLAARQHWISGVYGDIMCAQQIVRLCRQATAFDDDYAEAWALMALAQAELRFWHGTDEDALPAAERALALNPDLAEARCVRARYIEQEGREAEGFAEVQAALALQPESWEVNREAARMLYRQGRTAEAARYFEKCCDLMANDYHSGAMLISCYGATGDEAAQLSAAERTVQRCETAIARDPSNSACLAAGAGAMILLGEGERAKEWARRAMLLDPDNVSMVYNLACALTYRSMDLEGALELMAIFFDKLQSTTILRHSQADHDLDVIRDDPRYVAMFEQARERLLGPGTAEAPMDMPDPAIA